jgi:Domain of unknown function (DUF5063)
MEMRPSINLANTDQFIGLVQEYLAVIDGAGETTPHTLLSKCALLLPQIYSLGLQLPDVKPTDNEVEWADVPSPMSTLVGLLGKYDMYGEVFDPVSDDESTKSSLGDDLADIYLDLKRPLLEFEGGKANDAIWSWKFNISGHCGDHIVDALKVIHRLVHNHMPADYHPFTGDT